MILPLPIGQIEIKEVYVEHEEPLLYLAENGRGELFLVVLAQDLDTEQVWFFAPLSPRRAGDIRSGNIDLHDAFAQVEHGIIIALHRPRSEDDRDFTELLIAESIDEERLPRPNKRLRIEQELVSLPNVCEIANVQKCAAMTLRFIPRVRSQKEISVESCAKVLYGIQESIHAIGLHTGKGGGRTGKAHPKPIDSNPRNFRAETTLNVSAKYAASFGIELHSNSMVDLFDWSLAADSMAKLASLLGVISDREALLEQLAEFKGTYTASKIRHLLTGIGRDVVELQIRWASPRQTVENSISIDETQAQLGIKIIDMTEQNEPHEFEEVGTFSEAGVEPPTFHFITDDGVRKFKGRVDSAGGISMRGVSVLTTRYKVLIRETITTDYMNEQRSVYRLMQLSPLDS